MAFPAFVANRNESTDEATRWYAVHTLPHREFRAAKQLEFQGFTTYLPAVRKTVRHARRFRNVVAPFFPQYLFVQLDLARHRWRSVNGTFGVTSLIMEGERPKAVPRGVVEAISAAVDGAGHVAPCPNVGDSVRILTGPFADRVGKLLHIDERKRVQILLEMMGTKIVVRSNGDALVPT